MSSSHALFSWALVKKQKHDFHFLFRSVFNKTIIRLVFVITRIIKFSVRVISRSRWLADVLRSCTVNYACTSIFAKIIPFKRGLCVGS